MALTVGNLYKDSGKYQMTLIAGKEGLCNLVQWVHVVETIDGAKFLHGHEIVITEGILGDKEDLLLYVQMLYEQEASAVIINIGRFIFEVPKRVIQFCDEKQFPLFTIPWEISLVDVTKDYYQRIFDQEVREDNIIGIFKNIIFQVGDQEGLLRQMERYGYLSGNSMLCICIAQDQTMEAGQEEHILISEKMKNIVRRTAARILRNHDSSGRAECQNGIENCG